MYQLVLNPDVVKPTQENMLAPGSAKYVVAMREINDEMARSSASLGSGAKSLQEIGAGSSGTIGGKANWVWGYSINSKGDILIHELAQGADRNFMVEAFKIRLPWILGGTVGLFAVSAAVVLLMKQKSKTGR